MGAPADLTPEPSAAAVSVEAGAEMGLLKRLLFRAEQNRLEALQQSLDALAARVGDDPRLEASTAQVLAGALRRAEVERHGEMAQAMAPMVVAAIRSEIVNSRDVMVEALYPITGRLVAAAVANAFRELVERIETRIDSLLSSQLWRLRLRALTTGRPLSEILLEAAQKPTVRRLFALERASGLLVASWSAEGVTTESPELVSGMIAAVSQFASEAFSSEHGELRTLDMGASRILLRASARLIVAAEFAGEPHAADEARMDRGLIELVENAPQGPDSQSLAKLAAAFGPEAPAKKRSPAGKILFAVALALFVLWLADGPLRRYLDGRSLQTAFDSATEAQNLRAWPLRLTIDHRARRAEIVGLTPPDADVSRIAAAVAEAGPHYEVNTEIVAVSTTAATALVEKHLADQSESQVARVAALGEGVQGRLAAQDQRLTRQEDWRAAQEAAAASAQARLAALVRDSVIWFGESDEFADPPAAQRVIAALAEALKATGARLRVVGYSDSIGSSRINLALSQRRADSVVATLMSQGVDSKQLQAVGRGDEAAIAPQTGDERRRNRRAVFELVGPAERGE